MNQDKDCSQGHGTLNDIIHSPVRLSIMATLSRLGDSDFQYLKKLLNVSDSLLSKHTSILESAGYIHVTKEFVHRRPTTRFNLSREGKAAYDEYLSTLLDIVGDQDGAGS